MYMTAAHKSEHQSRSNDLSVFPVQSIGTLYSISPSNILSAIPDMEADQGIEQ